MKKFTIEITETLQKQVIVNANSREEAEDKVRNQYNNGDIILDDSNLMDTDCSGVTDDAMVVEQMTGHLIRFVEGSYMNIKITTPEDLEIGEVFIKRMMK